VQPTGHAGRDGDRGGGSRLRRPADDARREGGVIGKRSDVGMPSRVLADGWYSWVIPSFCPLTDITERWPRCVQEWLGRLGPLRALILFLASARYDVLAVIRGDRGWRSLLLMRALLGRRRKLVVLHFIDHPVRAGGIGNRVDRAWRPIDRWATRRAVLRAQVLSSWEREQYAEAFGVESERFCFIPFAWRMRAHGASLPTSSSEGVIAAGRAFCDWPTLFEAASSRPWPLLVVCAEHDRALVERLNEDRRATSCLTSRTSTYAS